MRRSGIQPVAGVLRIHAAAEVESAGKCGQRGARFGFIAGAELDDVTAKQAVAPVKFREPRGGFLGDKIGASAGVTQCAANDLLYFAFMQVNARTKHDVRLDSRASKAH